MNAPDAGREQLAFLLETVTLEAEHLQLTDQRFFASPFTAERAAALRGDIALAEQLDAFMAPRAHLRMEWPKVRGSIGGAAHFCLQSHSASRSLTILIAKCPADPAVRPD